MNLLRPLPFLLLLVPQDDPRKAFLQQKEWYGRFTVDIRGEGRKILKDIRGCETYEISHQAEVDFRIQSIPGEQEGIERMAKMLPTLSLPPEQRKAFETMMNRRTYSPDMKKKELISVCTVDDHRHGCGYDSCELDANPFQTWSRGAKGIARRESAAGAMMTVDLAKGTFDLLLSFDALVPVVVTSSGSSPIPPAKDEKVSVLVKDPSLRNQPLPKDLDTLKGTVDLTPDVQKLRPGDYGKITGTLEWILSPKPFEPVELVVDIPGYETWIPEAKADGGAGNSVTATATLRRKGGGETEETLETTTFRLSGVSDEPGVANNFPQKPQDQPYADLGFKPGQGVEEPARRKAVVRKEGKTASVEIESFDHGAFGKLQVEARLKSGRWVAGFMERKPGETSIPLPKREPASRIADAWKDKLGFSAHDESDEDAIPKGNGFAGDGLSLYEEYRGFYHKGDHLRTDPTKKDFFILDLNQSAKIQGGITLLKTLSQLETHGELKTEEMYGRRINFNSRECRITDQHGVVIDKFDATLTDVAGAVPIGKDKERTTPKDYSKIRIASNIQQKTARTVQRPSGPRSQADPLEVLIAHELLHTVNVPHHGDSDVDKATWVITQDAAGTWSMTEQANATSSPGPVTMVLENGQPFPFTKTATVEAYVGKKGGLFSGNEDCVMRYDNADAYVDSKNAAVRINVRGDDASGRSLCDSPAGTGINDPKRPGGSRFGPASKGNCKSYLCVSDRFK